MLSPESQRDSTRYLQVCDYYAAGLACELLMWFATSGWLSMNHCMRRLVDNILLERFHCQQRDQAYE